MKDLNRYIISILFIGMLLISGTSHILINIFLKKYDYSIKTKDRQYEKKIIKESNYPKSSGEKWPSNPGEFLVDIRVSWTFWNSGWDAPGFLGKWTDHEYEIKVRSGVSKKFTFTGDDMWSDGHFFPLATNSYNNWIEFNLELGYEYWFFIWIPDVYEDSILIPTAVEHDWVRTDFPMHPDEDRRQGLIEADHYTHTYIEDIGFSVPHASKDEPFEVSFTVYDYSPPVWGFTDIFLQRRIGVSGNWEDVYQWYQQPSYNFPKMYKYLEADGVDTQDQQDVEVYYRVLMSGEHYCYRSLENYRIMIEGSKPFISQYSVVLEKEKWDFGEINPTDIISIQGTIHNPTNSFISEDIYLKSNRFFSDEWENEMDTIKVGNLSAHETKPFSFRIPDSNKVTIQDTPYIIPGIDFPIDEKPDNNIELKEWNWYDKTTGEIFSTSRPISFEVWIRDREEDSKLVMEIPVFIPGIKIAYAKYIQKSYEIKKKVEETQQSIAGWDLFFMGLGATVEVVSLAALISGVGGPVGGLLAVAGVVIEAIGLTLFGANILCEIIKWIYDYDINNNIGKIIRDPPDPNIYSIAEIEYRELDLYQYITSNLNLKELCDITETLNE